MNQAWRTQAVRTIAVAAVAFATVLLSGAAPGAAASYTVNFTGTVSEVAGVFVAAGIMLGDAVSGSLTYDPISSGDIRRYPLARFHHGVSPGRGVVHLPCQPSGRDRLHPDPYRQRPVESHGSALGNRLNMYVDDGVAGLNLFYGTDGTNPALSTLAALPTDSNGILALLAGAVLTASGTYRLEDFGNIGFKIDFATATTPIPAALPLFISALGGLGLFGWRRRRGAAAFSL